jgi:hypothetical protein
MTFDDILDQVIALLKRQGRVSYGAMKRRFDLDDAYLEDLKGEILFAYPVVNEDGRGLVWTGETATVVISPDTYRLVEGYFTVEDLGRPTPGRCTTPPGLSHPPSQSPIV